MGSISEQEGTSQRLFNPAEHLSYEPPSKIISLEDIHFPLSPISPVASSVPFPLLTDTAIRQHRKELFSPGVLDNCLFHPFPNTVMLRGMAPRYAAFIHQFWTSPEVLSIISSIAGVDLVPVMDYEICHTNVQLGIGGVEGLKDIPVIPPEPTEAEKVGFRNQKEGDGEGERKSLVPSHRDSYPFVCVVMLSNAEFMTDGETELEKGDGTTMKVRAPKMGHAVVLQGRSVPHIALPAGNMSERITIVTSFRPRDPRLLDNSTIERVRTFVSHPTEVHNQWTTYRLELLSKRFGLRAEELRAKYEKIAKGSGKEDRSGDRRVETVDVDMLEVWMEEQIKYMRRTVAEMWSVAVPETGAITKA